MRLTALALLLAATPAAAHAQGAGSWSGAGLQLTARGEQEVWTVRVTFDAAGNARVDYPSLRCGGAWTRIGDAGGVPRYRERIRFGDCVDGGTVSLVRQAGALFVNWTGEESTYPEISAAAVLYPAAPIS